MSNPFDPVIDRLTNEGGSAIVYVASEEVGRADTLAELLVLATETVLAHGESVDVEVQYIGPAEAVRG